MFHCTENAVCTPDGEDTEPVFIKIPHPRTGDLRLVYPHQSSQLNFAICLLRLCKIFCLVNICPLPLRSGNSMFTYMYWYLL